MTARQSGSSLSLIRKSFPPACAAFQASHVGRKYTAGYEVMPRPSAGVSAYEPWIEAAGPVIFASPGRATVTGLAPRIYSAQCAGAGSERHGRTIPDRYLELQRLELQIAMHSHALLLLQ